VAETPEHLSIGEVLATLRDEFPDITISKIRFLESQGLIDPERTPSGYRKFYSADIDRLRWILHQQKEHFLPLKVIKGRLEDAPAGELPPDEGPAVAPEPDAGTKPAQPRATATGGRGSTAKAAKTAKAANGETAAAEPGPEPRAAEQETGKPRAAGRRAGTARRVRTPNDTPPLPLDDGAPDTFEPPDDDVGLTRAELATAAEVTPAQLTELEEYGLIRPAAGSGDRVLFGEEALVVAKLSAAFGRHGIDARHLRMYRAFADRESGLYAQVVQPVLRQRNPEARARARDDLVELARLGRELRTAFLRDAVSSLLVD
jgi:DNA-binding transcriptional MerR regulator